MNSDSERLQGRNIARLPVKEAMEIQDALPRGWRELVYDYGQTKVLTLLQRGYDLDSARQMLGAGQPAFSKQIRKCRR